MFLTDDCFTYLCSLYNLSKNNLFLTCQKLYQISNHYFNDVFINYKLLIRSNTLLNPKQSYASIFKIYGSSFIIHRYYLIELAKDCIITNNLELITLLFKVAPTTMNTVNLIDDLMLMAMNKKNIIIFNYLVNEAPLINKYIIEFFIRNYFYNKINEPLFLKSLYDLNVYHSIFLEQALYSHHLDLFKLVVNTNVDDLLKKSIYKSNLNFAEYIMTNFKYDYYQLHKVLKHCNTNFTKQILEIHKKLID